MTSLIDKVAVVTGGNSGIGKATAIALAKAGAKVVIAGRRTEAGEESVRLLQASGGEGIFVKTDATQEADIKTLINQTVETYSRLDYAFNNAGIEASGALTDYSEANFFGYWMRTSRAFGCQ